MSAAAEAAPWGGMSNAGQTCIRIERVYATGVVLADVDEPGVLRQAAELDGRGRTARVGCARLSR